MAAAAVVLAFALPALGQQGPESLLPEGFGDPAPSAPNNPTRPSSSSTPSTAKTATSSANPASGDVSADDAADDAEEDEEDAQEMVVRYDVPPAARRSLNAIGIISETSGGFPAASFGATNGAFLKQVVERT